MTQTRDTDLTGKTKMSARVVFWICLINSITSLFFGGLMMAIPVDTPLGLGALLPAMGDFPFQELFFRDLFWPGLALVLCNGVGNTVAVVALLKKAKVGYTLSLVSGVLLIAWCCFENIYMFNPPAVFYTVVGLIQIVVSRRLSLDNA